MSDMIEFVIPAKQGQEARRIKQHVLELFEVRILFVSNPQTVNQTGVEWIQLTGDGNLLSSAKEYITSTCTPEETKTIQVPESLHGLFRVEKTSPLKHIEKEYKSYVQFDPGKGICIKGKAIEVALIVSYLEQNIPKWKILQCRSSLASEEQKKHHSVRGDLRNYIKRLGYSDHQIDTAASNCGACPSENSLLQELLTLFGSTQPSERFESISPTELGGAPSDLLTPRMVNVSPTRTVGEVSTLQAGGGEITNTKAKLRHIVVDGSNVAMCHGNREFFSCRGIQICVDWFRNRGHLDITVIVPQWRKEESKTDNPILDREILLQLERERVLVFTPSRRVNGKRVVCYDDRYVVKVAAEEDGIIVSNDHFRDLEKESPEYKQVIDQRLLMYTFVNDKFMPPDDPLGRHGPSLEDFLKKGTPLHPKFCPYGRRCTYGQKCRYYHPKKEIDLQKRGPELEKSLVKVGTISSSLAREGDSPPTYTRAALEQNSTQTSCGPSSVQIDKSDISSLLQVSELKYENTRVVSQEVKMSCGLEAISQGPQHCHAGVEIIARGRSAEPALPLTTVTHSHGNGDSEVSPIRASKCNTLYEDRSKPFCYDIASDKSTNTICSPVAPTNRQSLERGRREEFKSLQHQQTTRNALHSKSDGLGNDSGNRLIEARGATGPQPGYILMPMQQGCPSPQVYHGHVPSMPSNALYQLNYDAYSFGHGAPQWVPLHQPSSMFIPGSPHVVSFTNGHDLHRIPHAQSIDNGTDILLELQRRFPGHNDKILQVLRQYPHEGDVEILSWLIQNRRS